MPFAATWMDLGTSLVAQMVKCLEDLDSISGSGRSPGEGNGNPLQYSCLENPMDRGTWWATVHGVAKSQTVILSEISQTEKEKYCMTSLICGI